ncbi:MAG: precorrin-2 C(20)-methyltransferase [Mariprofundaceae bacterium]|nr:precorrin-2 C(20)-methyltransferase [Mariprofundaceae bacterium]
MKTLKEGTLTGVSLGPGDPELMSRKAWSALHSQAIWCYPVKKKSGVSYALDIVSRAQLSPPEKSFALIFPMTHDSSILSKHWIAAAQQVLTHLQQGQDVVFLVEGDASTYSTFAHLARTISHLNDQVDIQIIPGISAYHAAAAKTKVSLADTDDTIAILPAGYGIETINSMLKDFDTLVLLKVKPLLDQIIDFLEQKELLDQAIFIEKVGSPQEHIVHDLLSLRHQKVNYLSLILLRNPNRQRGTVIRGCRKKL